MDRNPLRDGFLVRDFVRLNNWRVLEIDKQTKFDCQEKCPICEGLLKVICTLVGDGGNQRLRIGCCEQCSYVGYIDRPSEEWLENYYANDWGGTKTRDVGKRLAKAKRKIDSDILKNPNNVVLLASKLEIDKTLPACEIGSGNGKSLKQLEIFGFQNVIGVEASLQQAQVASQGYGGKVIVGRFESEAVQKSLRKLRPINVFLSHHVLEHSFQPKKMIQKISDLQDNGGALVIGVPNFVGESSLGTSFYAPHLHSFTPESLTKLLAGFGYKIVDSSLTNDQYIDVVAEKVGSVSTTDFQNDFFNSALAKLRSDLKLNRVLSKPRYYWCWPDYQARKERSKLGGRLHWWWTSRVSSLRESKKLRAMIIEPLRGRFTDPRESPIEVQFDGNIKLLVA